MEWLQAHRYHVQADRCWVWIWKVDKVGQPEGEGRRFTSVHRAARVLREEGEGKE